MQDINEVNKKEQAFDKYLMFEQMLRYIITHHDQYSDTHKTFVSIYKYHKKNRLSLKQKQYISNVYEKTSVRVERLKLTQSDSLSGERS